MDPGENHHENEKKTESCAADGGLPVGMAGGRGLSARKLALADAAGARAAAGDRLRQGKVHGRDGCAGAGRSVRRRGARAGGTGAGDGEGPFHGTEKRLFPEHRCRQTGGVLRAGRGGPDLPELLRPVAAQEERQAPPDVPHLPEELPACAAPERGDPLQDGQCAAVRVVARRI